MTTLKDFDLTGFVSVLADGLAAFVLGALVVLLSIAFLGLFITGFRI